jgi:hypothetical protein
MGEVGKMPGLTKGEFLNTTRGKVSRYNYNKWKRGLWIMFEVDELKSKTTIEKWEKLDFQRKLIKEMKKLRRSYFRSNIYLEVTFSANIENQTQIHTLAKNYLDLLGPPDSNKLEAEGVIYKDDSQIGILSIKHRLNIGSIIGNKGDSQSIEIRAMPLNKFMENLIIACDIQRELNDTIRYSDEPALEEETYERPFDGLDILSRFESIAEIIESLIETLEMIAIFRSTDETLSTEIANIVREIKEINCQKTIMGITKLNLFLLCSILARKLDVLDMFDGLGFNLIKVNISDFPSTGLLKRRVEDYLKNNLDFPIKLPLKIPISLTTFVPSSLIRQSLVDLDNFVSRTIIKPVLNTIGPPPLPRFDWERIKYILLYALEKGYFEYPLFQTIMNSIEVLEKLSNVSMIRSYNVIPLEVLDISKDKMYILLTNLEDEISLLRTLDNIIDKAEEYLCDGVF